MTNFTMELKNIMTEDPGVPIMSPDELRARSQTIVLLTNSAPDELLALAGPDRKATLLSVDPPMITLPYQKGVFKVRPEDIVFETHHTGRDVTEAGAEETSYEKFFASAMKKFGVGSPIELSPEDTKKFFNYVDKNWEAEEETDEDATEDVSTGKVGKKDKGSYQHAYKLALKKYKIHSADELDTPEERKGFTDYVDRLWKKGDIHRDKKEASIDIDELFGRSKTAAERDAKEEKRIADRLAKAQARDEKDKERKEAEIKKKADKDAAEEQAKIDKDAEIEKKKAEEEAERNMLAAMTPEQRQEYKIKQAAKKERLSKAGALGRIKSFGARLKKGADYDTKAKFVEGVKKTPGVSKKARGAVGFAKHARKGTGAKRQFQKGVRQAGKKQASNEVLYQAPKSNKKTPETSWDKASEDKRAELLQLASPRTSTKYTKLDYRELTPMLQKAIDKLYKTKKAKLEVSPPDRKFQVKGIKKHLGQKGKKGIPKTYVDKKTGKRKESNPWAMAWGQYDKYGVPSKDEKD